MRSGRSDPSFPALSDSTQSSDRTGCPSCHRRLSRSVNVYFMPSGARWCDRPSRLDPRDSVLPKLHIRANGTAEFARRDLSDQAQMVDRHHVSPDGMKYTFTLLDSSGGTTGSPSCRKTVWSRCKRWGKKDRFGQLLMAHTGKIAPSIRRPSPSSSPSASARARMP